VEEELLLPTSQPTAVALSVWAEMVVQDWLSFSTQHRCGSKMFIDLKNTMENRVKRFYDLHQNKWFHVMNLSLEIIKTADVAQKHMLSMYGAMFFF
jgi:hypothetical protein